MKRILTIWATLGAAYVVFETLFRGYSHPSMFVVGGLCGVLVGTINQAPRFYRARSSCNRSSGLLSCLR